MLHTPFMQQNFATDRVRNKCWSCLVDDQRDLLFNLHTESGFSWSHSFTAAASFYSSLWKIKYYRRDFHLLTSRRCVCVCVYRCRRQQRNMIIPGDLNTLASGYTCDISFLIHPTETNPPPSLPPANLPKSLCHWSSNRKNITAILFFLHLPRSCEVCLLCQKPQETSVWQVCLPVAAASFPSHLSLVIYRQTTLLRRPW